jgi:hypothetical protein
MKLRTSAVIQVYVVVTVDVRIWSVGSLPGNGQLMPSDAADSAPPVVYLHIGSPKSGTTFLQQVMWSNLAPLADQGVLLPGGSFRAQERAMQDLREMRRHPADPAPPWDGEWDRLGELIRARRPRAAVISHELISGCDDTQAKRAVHSLAPADVHVVYTIRDLVGLLPSEWQENVKHRTTTDYATWLSRIIDDGLDSGEGRWFWRFHGAVDILRRWSALVPRDHVHVITMPRPGSPRTLLWERFAALIGVDPDSVRIGGVRANASLGVVETELIRRVNQALDPTTPHWHYTSTMRDLFAQQVLVRRPSPVRPALPANRRPWARERARELVAGLRSGGYDIIGDLDELWVDETDGTVGTDEAGETGEAGELAGRERSRPAEVTEGQLLDAAADGIAGLCDHIVRIRQDAAKSAAELRTDIDRLRGEIGDLNDALRDERTKPLHKAIVRNLSERHPAVMRLRVAYWHLVERMRARRARRPS